MMHLAQGLALFAGATIMFNLLAGTAAAMSLPRWVAGSPVSYRPTAIAVVMAACAFVVAVAVGTKVALDVVADSGLWPNSSLLSVFAQYVIGIGLSVASIMLSAAHMGPRVYNYLLGPRYHDQAPIAFVTNRRRGLDVP